MSFSPIRRPSSPSNRSLSDLGQRISSSVHGSVKAPSMASHSELFNRIRAGMQADSFQPAPTPPPVDLGQTAPSSPPSTTAPAPAPVGAAPASAPSGALDSGPGGDAQVDEWILQAEQKMGRDFTAEEEEAIRVVAYYESRNDPNASNDWDANAQAGNPSQGLMQVTQSNFNTYCPGGNIFDPVDNIIAAVRYADERYGGIDQSKGYIDWKNGGGTDPYGGWNGGYTWY